MKERIIPIINKLIKARIIVISLVVLVVFGYTLLQLQKVSNPSVNQDQLERGREEQRTQRIKLNQETLDEIKKRQNFAPTSTDPNQRNPFF